MPTWFPTQFEPTWFPTEFSTPYPTSVTEAPSQEPTSARLGEALEGGIFLHEEDLTFKTTDVDDSESTEDSEQSMPANMLTDAGLSSGDHPSLSMLTIISGLTICGTVMACIL